jgi:hypothetical protein
VAKDCVGNLENNWLGFIWDCWVSLGFEAFVFFKLH